MVDEIGARALQHEVDIVRSAVDMVAGRHARRVTVGGLSFGQALVGAAERMAQEAGVRVVPLWHSDDNGSDFLVERDADA